MGGEVAVETLAAGDLVLTAEGDAKPVRWLGRQTVSSAQLVEFLKQGELVR